MRIGETAENEIPMEAVLEQQLLDLRNKQLMIQGAMDLCQRSVVCNFHIDTHSGYCG